jgi:hypothetical protein
VYSRDDLVALVGAEQERILEGFAGLAVQVGSPDRLQFWDLADRVVRHEVAAEIVLYPALRQLPGGEVLAEGMVRSQNLIQQQILSMERSGIGASSFERGPCDLWSMVHDQAERQTAYVLPLLVVALPQWTRTVLGRRYEQVRDTPPHPPAPTTAAGHETNAIVGPMAALAEWIRDSAGPCSAWSADWTCRPVPLWCSRTGGARPTTTATPSLGQGGGRTASCEGPMKGGVPK